MAMIDDADRAWEFFGKHDPYFGVLTAEQYHAKKMTEESRRIFFETGQQYIQNVLSAVRKHLDPQFSPKRALDFGCGVGRLLMPLASICDEVTGVDVSESMLMEARNNCDQRKLGNVVLVKADDTLSGVSGSFNFINSYLVFQHIPRQRGEEIFRHLINRLNEGGVGVVQVIYMRKSSFIRKYGHWARTMVPFFNGLVNLVILKKPFSYPMMQMNEYKLERLFSILQDNNCSQSYVFFNKHSTDDTSAYSCTIFFQKRNLPEL